MEQSQIYTRYVVYIFWISNVYRVAISRYEIERFQKLAKAAEAPYIRTCVVVGSLALRKRRGVEIKWREKL